MIMAPTFCSMKKRTDREVFTFLSVRFLESLNINNTPYNIDTAICLYCKE